jgi:hypothetical protein
MSTWLPVVGGIIVVAVLILVAVLVFLRPGTGGTNTGPSGAPTSSATTTNGGATQKGPSSLIGEGDPQIYWDTIKAQVAQGLHLSTSDLSDKLKPPTSTGGKGGPPPTGVTIGEIATQQGVSLTDLHTIETNAIQQATTTLVSQGSISQQTSDQRMQTVRGWSQDSLDGYTMYAFQNH